MNRLRRAIALAVALQIALANSAEKPQLKKLEGEISDDQCASNIHSLSRSHKEMLATQPNMGSNAADCSRYCVNHGGGEYVLNSAGKVYRLDNPQSFEPYAGKKVMVTGYLDPRSKVLSIQSLKESK